MEAFSQGMLMLADPMVWIVTLLGVVAGTVVGAIPGLTATMAVAVLVPFTFSMQPILGLSMLSGIYIGGIYGGSISAILLRIPGTPSSIMTARDGYPLAQKGEAGRAIGISTVASFVGGFVSIIALIVAAPLINKFALKFSAPEFFAVAIWGLASIADVTGKRLLLGLVSAAVGVLLGTVGMDPGTGIPRFTLGLENLTTGIEFVPMMIGLYGMSEALRQLGDLEVGGEVIRQRLTRLLPSWSDLKGLVKTITRGTLLGLWVGVLPGATGGAMASIVAYNAEVKAAKDPERFGQGAIEGIAASESANNATVGGSLIPMLTLGIPGDTITAILIGAFTIHNLQPGPMLFQKAPDLMYALYGMLLLAHIMMLAVGLSGASLFARAVSVPKRILVPLIIVLSLVGAYAVNNNLFDIGLAIFFGVVGYAMERYQIPVAPLILGVVLGPLAEGNLRTSLLMSQGDLSIFWTRPLVLFFWFLTALMLLGPRVGALWQRLIARAGHQAAD